MKSLKRLIFVLLLSVTTSLTIQAAVITGQVRTKGSPISGVVVTDGYSVTKSDKNGMYKLTASEKASFVYISIPSGYSVKAENSVPQFFQKINPAKIKYDFELTKKPVSDKNHGFVVIADPQVWAGKEFSRLRSSVEDIKNEISGLNRPLHGICCGDIVSNDHSLYGEYNKVIESSGLQFFSVMGNHDMTLYGRSMETSQKRYEETFGPAYYSYNVGDIHYVALNDNFYIARDYFYIGYLEERQFAWLEKDLANVKKGATVVITLHIPTSCEPKDRAEFRYDRAGNTMTNHKALYDLVKEYNVHILSGHTHTAFNQQINANLYEHVTPALSGAWWQGSLCTDGTPAGYSVFEANGSELKWYYKSVGYDKSHQMRLYDGEKISEYKGYIVANIWNADESWSVEMSENGGDPIKMERFQSYDAAAKLMYSDRSKMDHKWIYPSAADHFYRAVPKSNSSVIEVIAKDRFGNTYKQTLSRSGSLLSGDVFDVLVIGGGTSGTAAAIQASRNGVKTLLAEEFEWLGGMLTSAGVSAVDGNYNLKGGLWGEFRDSLARHYGSEAALATGWVSRILFEPSVGNRIFQNIAAKERNLTLSFKTGLKGFTKVGDLWKVELIKNGQTVQVFAKYLIDGTELGDVAKRAGVRYDIGMDSKLVTGEVIAPESENDIIQDLTYAMILKEYDRDMTIAKPEGYNPSLFYCSTKNEKCTHPKEKQRLWSKDMMITYGKLPNKKYMINWPIEGNDFYVNMIEMTQEQRVDALKQAKNMSLCFLYYIQTELGFKNLGIADDEFPTADKFPFIAYHRESRRIDGLVRFTLSHVTDPYTQKEKLYRTAVGVGDYPVDHHHTRYSGWSELPDLHFFPVPSYGFPLGIMIPKGVNGLIVAEKSVSVTNIVNGSTRLQPVVLQIGQAAGALAALAVKKSLSPSAVSVRDVQRAILSAGGYLLPYLDLPATHPHFAAMQRIGVTGIIKGKGMNKGWENQTWFLKDSVMTCDELAEGLSSYYTSVDKGKELVNISNLKGTLSKITGFSKDEISNILKRESKSLMLENIDTDRPLTRIEIAVILDRIADPFGSFEIDIFGELKLN